jgi:hypothetical protein
MSFIEFLEALARVAEKISPVPFHENPDAYDYEELITLPLHLKLESLISNMQEKLFLDKDKRRSTIISVANKQEGNIFKIFF